MTGGSNIFTGAFTCWRHNRGLANDGYARQTTDDEGVFYPGDVAYDSLYSPVFLM
jgi:hypothetical protein